MGGWCSRQTASHQQTCSGWRIRPRQRLWLCAVPRSGILGFCDSGGVTAEPTARGWLRKEPVLQVAPTFSSACIPHTARSGSSVGCTSPPGAWPGSGGQGQLVSLRHPHVSQAHRFIPLPRCKPTQSAWQCAGSHSQPRVLKVVGLGRPLLTCSCTVGNPRGGVCGCPRHLAVG